jgi:hypothetical protein
MVEPESRVRMLRGDVPLTERQRTMRDHVSYRDRDSHGPIKSGASGPSVHQEIDSQNL